MIAAVYVRVSTQDQAEHGYSLGDQEERCVARAKELGAQDVHVFTDPGRSGGKLDRPGLTALRQAIRTGGIDVVVIVDPDRLARNLGHQLLVTDEIEKAGARLEFLNFDWQNTPEGRLFYSLRGAVAEFEKEKIRERSVRGKEAKARAGKVVAGGWYGYRRTDSGDYEPDPSTAPVVADMFRWVATERLAGMHVARRLGENGIPGPKGGLWYARSVLWILRNPVYAGTALNFRERYRHEVTYWSELEGRAGVIPVAVTPIVSRDLWERAQVVLDNFRPKPGRRDAKASYLLTGLVICGQCGLRMSPTSTTSQGVLYRYYRCTNFARRRFGPNEPAKCRTNIRAEHIEAVVWRELIQVLNHPDRVLDELERESGSAANEAENARLRDRLNWWRAKRARTLQAFTSGWIPEEEARQNVEACDREIATAQREMARLERAATGSQFTAQQAGRLREYCGRLLAGADSASTADKRAIARALVERIVYEGGHRLRIVGTFDAAAVADAGFALEASIPSKVTG